MIFRINEELASVAVTATELLAVTRSYSEVVKNEEFLKRLYSIVSEINKCFPVVTQSFSPFYRLEDEGLFGEDFEMLVNDFKGNYLMEVSKPRAYCENVYDAFIALQQSKEAKSSFPALKRNYQRLDKLYDKWISNDNFLGLSIDGVLKQKNLLLTQINELRKKDEEDAWLVFKSAFDDFSPMLTLIGNQYEQIEGITSP